MLAMLGKKLEDKMEFVKNEGFKKLLLLGGDKNIRKEIMKTLKLYVDVKIEEEETKSNKAQLASDLSDSSRGAQSEKIENQQLGAEENKGNLKGKLKNIAKEFKDILGFNEKKNTKTDENNKHLIPSTEEDPADDRDNNADKEPFDIDFPPNAESLKEFLKEFKTSAAEEGGRSSIFELLEENTKELSTNEVERIT